MKLSLLIPVGRFSFFVHACLQNVFETCGSHHYLDFVFVTSQHIEPHIQDAFLQAQKKYSFRVLSAPFDAGSDHLRLLDWAIYNADLNNWIIIQHCDLFWKETNWLLHIMKNINPDLFLICTPCQSKYNYRPTRDDVGKNIPIVGDFLGVYNRRLIIEQKLFFKWGLLGSEVEVSDAVVHAIQNGLIYRRNGDSPIEMGVEFMDGSQAMAWELIVRNAGIGHINVHFDHLVAFFRIADSIHRVGNELRCNLPINKEWFAIYSYVTSFCIDREEVEDVALPWALLKHAHREHDLDINNLQARGEQLRRYSVAKNVIGMDHLGLKQVRLNEQDLIPPPQIKYL